MTNKHEGSSFASFLEEQGIDLNDSEKFLKANLINNLGEEDAKKFLDEVKEICSWSDLDYPQ